MVAVRGLVLGGGGVPGIAAHLGFLRGLSEAGVSWEVVVGISAGGIVAGGLAAGLTLDAMEHQWRHVVHSAWSLVPREVVHLLFSLRPSPTPGLLDLTWVVQQTSVGRKLFVNEWVPGYGVVVSDVTDGCSVLVSHDHPVVEWTVDALVATAAFPGLFSGVRAPNGHLLVDGGLYSEMPVWAAAMLGATRVVVVRIGRATSGVPGLTTLDELFWVLADQLAQRSSPTTAPASVPQRVVELPTRGGLLSLAEWDRDYSVGYETAQAQAADLESFWSA